MGRSMTMRAGLVVAVVAALTAAVGAAAPATAGQTEAATTQGRDRQVAFLNHTYTVLDPATIRAVSRSAYLKRFASYEERTTTNGQTTYTGRYLMGRETYLELFPEGALPPPDDQRGTTGLALGTDREDDLETVTQRLRDLGVAEPSAFTQTKLIDGEAVPWFDVVTPVATYEAGFPWVMEYLPSYFDDPRTGLHEPAAFLGDVSRERYLGDGYRDKLMRDVVGLDLALPPADLDAFAVTLRAAGYVVRDTRAGTVAVGRGSVVRMTPSSDAGAGWKRIVFSLNASQRTQHVEHLGSSTLRVGPGPVAVWTFG